MKIQKQLSALILTVVLMCAMGVNAYAHDVPDLNRRGTINITMQQGDIVVGGGTLTLYHVGTVKEDNGNYGFAFTGDFADCGKSLEDISSPELASDLADYAKQHNVLGNTQNIGEDGKISFADQELGLFLLVQNKAADGYMPMKPFLVSVPISEKDAYVYTVEVSPKVELEKASEPEPVTPTKPGAGTLPQTGQLKWPIPVLVVLGLGLFSAGWILRFGKKRNAYAK